MSVQSMLNKLHGQPDSYDKKSVLPFPPYFHSEQPETNLWSLTDGTQDEHGRRHRTENELRRAKYRMGKTLGAGTYGIVREADSPEGKVAVKIILKKNVKGNDQMVYDELEMLQSLHHKHIVKFVDWFESRVRGYQRDSDAMVWNADEGQTGQILHRHRACHWW